MADLSALWLLFAIANNCLCQISDFENKFSVAICQTQQSTIATAPLGLLKPAAVVSSLYRCFAMVVYREIPKIGDRRETLAYFVLSYPIILDAYLSQPSAFLYASTADVGT